MRKKATIFIIIFIALLLSAPQIYNAVNKPKSKPIENKEEEPATQEEISDSLILEELNKNLHDMDEDTCTLADSARSEIDGEPIARITINCRDYAYSAMTSLSNEENARKNYRDDYLTQKYADNIKELYEEILNKFNEKYNTNILAISISGEDYYFESDEKAEILKSIDSWDKAYEIMKSREGKGEITLYFAFNISDTDVKALGGETEAVSKFESYIKTEYPGISPAIYLE